MTMLRRSIDALVWKERTFCGGEGRQRIHHYGVKTSLPAMGELSSTHALSSTSETSCFPSSPREGSHLTSHPAIPTPRDLLHSLSSLLNGLPFLSYSRRGIIHLLAARFASSRPLN